MGGVLLIICILLSAGASIFLKMGALALAEHNTFLSVIKIKTIWLGGVCYFTAFLGYIYALKIVPLSLAQPVITTGVTMVTAIAAVLILREQMFAINWVGVVFLCFGVLFLFWGRV